MDKPHPVERLAEASHRFGPGAAKEKLRLLTEIRAAGRLSRSRLEDLAATLAFLRAYPDDARVLAAARDAIAFLRDAVERATGGDPVDERFRNTGLPGSSQAYPYSHAVVRRLTTRHPGRLELDWDELEDEGGVADALILASAPAEARGLEDESLALREWLDHARGRPGETGLERVLRIVATIPEAERIHVLDSLSLPVLYPLGAGAGRCEVALEPSRIHYQKRPVSRDRFHLARRIVPPPKRARLLSPSTGRRMLDVALAALCSRNLEIYPLTYADPGGVTRVDTGRGLSVVLAGMAPSFRCVPETLLFFLILKNGVPIAYGPASIFVGCCEMGINLFPEFRGGEIRFLYAELLRALHALAGVRYFYLVAYGMGEGNPEALRSGAFWFYRGMGFRATNPQVEALARAEEEIMRRRPGYRCSLATLRKLSHTEAHLDLSKGVCRPLDFGGLGLAVTGLITRRFAGDRERAGRACERRVIRDLGIRDAAEWTDSERQALRRLAPVVALLDDLPSWSRAERRSLARWIRAKGGRSELEFARRGARHARLAEGLHAAAARET